MESYQYRPSRFSLLPEVVKNLLIINGLFFLAKISCSNFGIDLDDLLGLHYFGASKFRPYQLITYMFMHGNFSHLFFNMFAIWMFGSALENFWGGKKFLIYYLITGLGAALIHYGIVYFEIRETIQLLSTFIENPTIDTLEKIIHEDNYKFIINKYRDTEIGSQFALFEKSYYALQTNSSNQESLSNIKDFMIFYIDYFKNLPVVVGASGSLFGLLLAYGIYFPNTPLYIMFFPFPIKAKYFVIGYGLIELFSGLVDNPNDNVAHFAHLGGMLFGYITLLFWKKRRSRWS